MPVGMPQEIYLNMFGKVVFDAFGEWPYLVGSALAQKRDWRDVDVRLILDDVRYAEVIGTFEQPPLLNPRWRAFCLAFSALGRSMTGLPIDFQIDQQSDANTRFNGPRSALIMCGDYPIIRAGEETAEDETDKLDELRKIAVSLPDEVLKKVEIYAEYLQRKRGLK